MFLLNCLVYRKCKNCQIYQEYKKKFLGGKINFPPNWIKNNHNQVKMDFWSMDFQINKIKKIVKKKSVGTQVELNRIYWKIIKIMKNKKMKKRIQIYKNQLL